MLFQHLNLEITQINTEEQPWLTQWAFINILAEFSSFGNVIRSKQDALYTIKVLLKIKPRHPGQIFVGQF